MSAEHSVFRKPRPPMPAANAKVKRIASAPLITSPGVKRKSHDSDRRRILVRLEEPLQHSHALVEALAKRWNIQTPYARMVLQEAAQDFFVFNSGRHAAFADALERAWDALQLPRNTRSGRSHVMWTHYTVRDMSITPASGGDPLLDLVQLVHVQTTEELVVYRTRRFEYEALLSTVLADEEWCASVQCLQQIPCSLQRGMLLLNLPFASLFPRFSSAAPALPSWLNLCVNAARASHHIENTLTQVHMQELELRMEDARRRRAATAPGAGMPVAYHSDEEDSGDDDDDTCSSAEGAAFFAASTDTLRRKQAESFQLLPEDRWVRLRHGPMARDSKPKVGTHVYALSAAVFAMASRCFKVLQEQVAAGTEEARCLEEWPIARIYYFCREWLRMNDHVVLGVRSSSVPQAVQDHARVLLQLLEGGSSDSAQLLEECDRMMRAWGSQVRDLVRLHQSRERSQGRFVAFRLYNDPLAPPDADAELMLAKLRDGFLLEDSQMRGRSLLVLDRKRVHPLSLRHSLLILRRWFFERELPTEEGEITSAYEWPLWFDEQQVYVLAPQQELARVLRYCNPYVPTSQSRFLRSVPYPLHLFHLHGFFHGGRKGLLLCLKFILRTMSATPTAGVVGAAAEAVSVSGRALLPSSDADPTVDCYRLLPHLLDRCFDSEDAVWSELVDPFRYPDRLYVSPRGQRVQGLHDQGYTLYHALRAFALVHAQHTIATYAVHEAVDLFLRHAALQHAFPLAWRLLHYLFEHGGPQEGPLDACDTSVVAIPGMGFFDPVEEFPYPTHMVLYQACSDVRMPSEHARRLFLAVGCTLRGRERDRTRPYPLRFSASDSAPVTPIAPVKRQRKAQTQQPQQEEDVNARLRPHVDLAVARLASWCKQQAVRKDFLATEEGLREHTPLHAPALLSLLRSLEELSVVYSTQVPVEQVGHPEQAPRYRGHASTPGAMDTLDAGHLLMDSRLPAPFPLDWDPLEGTPLTSDRSLPVWPCGLLDLSEHPDNQDGQARLDGARLLSWSTTEGSEERTTRALLFQRLTMEARPFSDAHPDLLPCILLHPVEEVCVGESTDAAGLLHRLLTLPVLDIPQHEGWMDVRKFWPSSSSGLISPPHAIPPAAFVSPPSSPCFSPRRFSSLPPPSSPSASAADGDPSVSPPFSLGSAASTVSCPSITTTLRDHPILNRHKRAFYNTVRDRAGWNQRKVANPGLGPSVSQVFEAMNLTLQRFGALPANEM